ncbi:hypothetical protein [Burkholderia sp. Nafp2/4-1b]|uniref:hypothetical protein n=1 Tax=Burkholderia sp. Nafp2/4-1b TaxID=2116686 RepID=UPI0013CE8156|nr:hypothetical protein [Burkholderia sp. Nafp2/4-1b]
MTVQPIRRAKTPSWSTDRLRAAVRAPAPLVRRQTPATMASRRCTGIFRHRESTRSAKKPWNSGVCSRKSLIVERTPATGHPEFATGWGDFATCPVSSPIAAAPFSLLFKSLKKKKKEGGEVQKLDPDATPQVMAVLPRVWTPAYFLSHGLAGLTTGFSWQSVAHEILTNQ